MNGSLQEVQRLGQSIWYDNIRRGLLASGELEHLIELGVTGLTSNPTIFEKAIAGSTDYDEALVSLAREGHDTKETYERLAMEDIRAVALPVLRHRIIVNFHAEAQAVNGEDLARRLLDSVQPDGSAA